VEPLVFVSRYFVDFVPFLGTEVADLYKRRVFGPTDYAREAGSTRWMPINEWVLLKGKKEKKTRLVQQPAGAWGTASRRPVKPGTRKKAPTDLKVKDDPQGDY
jgi:hypothetical protein